MKIPLFSILIFLFLFRFTFAQNLVRTDTLSVPIQLQQQNGKLALSAELESLVTSSTFTPLLSIDNIQLDEADAVITYKLVKLKPNFYYDIHLLIQPRDTFEESYIPNFRELDGVSGALDWTKEAPYQTRWKDVTEGKMTLNDVYDLEIQYELRGNLDCEQAPKPDFSIQKNWYHYLTTATGISLIAVGQHYGNQADERYQHYLRAWEEGAIEAVGQPLLDEANQNVQRHNTLKNLGIGVLITQGIVVGIQYIQYRKRVSAYKSYCGKKVSTDLSLGYLEGQPIVGLNTRIYLSK